MALVRVVLTDSEAKVPEYKKDGDAGADVHCVPNSKSYTKDKALAARGYLDVEEKYAQYERGDYILEPGETIMVDLGFKIELLPTWEMQVRSRSGLAKRGVVVANAPGTIDSGYRGPCMVLLRNNNTSARILKSGTRVAQFVLKQAPQAMFELTDSLSDSDRGESGFGSTGTR